MNKSIIICGPTATGKTSLGVKLAKKYNGEIISADSRQVYEGMDVGTGKDLPVNSKLKTKNLKLGINNNNYKAGYRLKNGIPIWLVDIVRPDQNFSVADFVFLAEKVISDILTRKKLPIIVGGTGFYIKGLTEPIDTIGVVPDKKLRKQLSQYTKGELSEMLLKTDRKKWDSMNYSDRNNPRRLIRAIEIAKSDKNKLIKKNILKKIDFLWIGLTTENRMLYKRIDQRVEKRIEQGVIEEVKNLLNKGYNFSLPSMTSLGYKQLNNYISKSMVPSSPRLRRASNGPFDKAQGKQSSNVKLFDITVSQWKYAEHAYARRQLIWFKKKKNIHWFDIQNNNYKNEIEKLVVKWYTQGK